MWSFKRHVKYNLKSVFILVSFPADATISMQCLNLSSARIFAKTVKAQNSSFKIELDNLCSYFSWLNFPVEFDRKIVRRDNRFRLSDSVQQENAQQYPSLLLLIPIKSWSSASLFRDSEMKTSSKRAKVHTSSQRGTLHLEKYLYPLNFL